MWRLIKKIDGSIMAHWQALLALLLLAYLIIKTVSICAPIHLQGPTPTQHQIMKDSTETSFQPSEKQSKSLQKNKSKSTEKSDSGSQAMNARLPHWKPNTGSKLIKCSAISKRYRIRYCTSIKRSGEPLTRRM